jgi:hypothetical protein
VPDGEGADRAVIVIAAMRVVFGHCPRDQVPDFTYYYGGSDHITMEDMGEHRGAVTSLTAQRPVAAASLLRQCIVCVPKRKYTNHMRSPFIGLLRVSDYGVRTRRG